MTTLWIVMLIIGIDLVLAGLAGMWLERRGSLYPAARCSMCGVLFLEGEYVCKHHCSVPVLVDPGFRVQVPSQGRRVQDLPDA